MNISFWATIKESEGNPVKLASLLAQRSSDEIAAFGREYNQALVHLNRWEIWGAGYVIAGGMSDDGFHYFRSWIIGRGEDAYHTALTAPDEIGRFATPGDDFENEALEYVAVELLEERGLADPRDDCKGFPDDPPTGEPWNEDEVFAKYPMLSARFA